MLSDPPDEPLAPPPEPLRWAVTRSVLHYLRTTGTEHAQSVYHMVWKEVDGALVAAVLEHTGFNQSQAAIILGISRITLRKKIRELGIVYENNV